MSSPPLLLCSGIIVLGVVSCIRLCVLHPLEDILLHGIAGSQSSLTHSATMTECGRLFGPFHWSVVLVHARRGTSLNAPLAYHGWIESTYRGA